MPVVAALFNESAAAATVVAGLIPACKMKFSINKKFTTKLEYKEASKFYAIRGFKQDYVYITPDEGLVTKKPLRDSYSQRPKLNKHNLFIIKRTLFCFIISI